MPSFLSDVTPFLGTGEPNEQGLSLQNYLEQYDPLAYENPSVTADIVVFRQLEETNIAEGGWQVLLVKRKNHPCIGQWALPGGFVNLREDIETAVKRELLEETGIEGLPVEQLYTWGEANRDPRHRIITVAYMSVADAQKADLKAGDDAADAVWADLSFRKLSEEELPPENGLESRSRERYEMVLTCDSKGIAIRCAAARQKNKRGWIRETSYTVAETGGLAFDHPRFLLKAILELQGRGSVSSSSSPSGSEPSSKVGCS